VLTPPRPRRCSTRCAACATRGTTILLITHKLKEIMALCDAVTVMRAGAVVLDTPSPTPASTAWPRPWSAAACTSAAPTAMRRRAKPGPVLLQAEDLVWRDALGVPRLDGVSLTLRAGEIVGIAGVSGNGQSELLDVLSGMHAPQSGTLRRGR
jgi:ABC-type uncharacterized transport system ATPase subunit